MTARPRGKQEAAPAEKMSGRAIQQAVLGQALQHPTTLYPFTAGAIAATYGILVAPFLGGAPVALVVAAGATLISAGSFIWRYVVQGEDSARAMARRAIESAELRRKDDVQEAIEEERSALQTALDQAQWSDGREALDELASEHDRLQSALERNAGLDPLARVRIERSAVDAYREGLGALSGATELMRAIGGTDGQRLGAELKELESALAMLDATERSGPAGLVKQQAIDLHRHRLEALSQQKVDVERLLHQANLACAALHRAHGTLGLLDRDASAASVDDVTADLDRTVEQTLRAQRSLQPTISPPPQPSPVKGEGEKRATNGEADERPTAER